MATMCPSLTHPELAPNLEQPKSMTSNTDQLNLLEFQEACQNYNLTGRAFVSPPMSVAERLGLALQNTFGASQGLNADWSVDAWPIGGGLWILDNEDGTFALVKRTTVNDEFVIEELGRIQP